MGYGPEALVHAAEKAEEEGQWRHAYGFWKEAISQYSSWPSVSRYEVERWETHMEECRQKMKQ